MKDRSSAITLTAFLLFMAPSASAQQSAFEEGRAVQRRAATAYERGDLDTFVSLTRAALVLRPNHPALLYNLAAGLARMGQPDSAAVVLVRAAELGLTFDVHSDPDFTAAHRTPSFEAASRLLAANAKSVVRSDTAFTLPVAAGIPESVAFLPADSTFLVTSVLDRAIYRKRGPYVDKLIDLDTAFFDECPCHGGMAPGAAQPSASDRVSSFVALAYDARRDVLWATRSPIPELQESAPRTDGPPGPRSTPMPPPALLRVGYASGTLLSSYELPSDAIRFLGDVAVGSDGAVYASETREGAVYVLRPGADSLATLLPPGTVVSPQGIAPHPSGTSLFLADYAAGIIRVDTESGKTRRVEAPDDAILLGIDGLQWYDGSLIAVQNGIQPQRVLRLTLSMTADTIERVAVLEASHPAYPEPTTGVIVDDALLYVANSDWNLLNRPGRDPVRTPLILRLPLDP